MDLNELLEVAQIFGDLRDAEEQAEDPTSGFLQRMDAFALSEIKFIKFFRLNKELARNVIELVTPYLVEPSRRSALSAETKVLIALKFFGLGSYQEVTGTNAYTAVSQSSVSRAIREVCDALTQPDIFQQWVHFPRNIRELENRRRRFYDKYEFPGVIGVIDCTHVAIVSPKRNDDVYPEHIYINRKNYHSINVQLSWLWNFLSCLRLNHTQLPIYTTVNLKLLTQLSTLK